MSCVRKNTGANIQIFLLIAIKYAVKVSKKIRFRWHDTDKMEEFEKFGAIVCDMRMSLSMEGWFLHHEVETLSAKRGLSDRMHNVPGTVCSWNQEPLWR